MHRADLASDAPSFARMGQVFDSGLLGEGVLHMLAWTRARLAAPDATLVRVATCLALFLRLPQAHE